MLILTRWTNQSIVINDNILIKIIATKGQQVRVGIEAPNSVPIFRRELIDDPSKFPLLNKELMRNIIIKDYLTDDLLSEE